MVEEGLLFNQGRGSHGFFDAACLIIGLHQRAYPDATQQTAMCLIYLIQHCTKVLTLLPYTVHA